MPKHDERLCRRPIYPPKLHPGQQWAGPLVSQSSLNWGWDLNLKDSTVHMEMMESQLNRDWFLNQRNDILVNAHYTGSGYTKIKNQKWKYAVWYWYSTIKIFLRREKSKMRKHKAFENLATFVNFWGFWKLFGYFLYFFIKFCPKKSMLNTKSNF